MKDVDEEVKLESLGDDYPKPILIEDLGYIYPKENSKWKRRYGLYKCGFCGNEFKAQVHNINREATKSCGCYNKRRVSETQKTHGLKSTRLYGIWGDIKNRILNPKNKRYSDYGGRGITICEEWKNDFKTFYDWSMSNGYEENKGLSIDRIDNDGNYYPENCRWVGDTIQARNKRIRKDNKSGFKGVCHHKGINKYMSYINVDKNRIHLGLFPTAVEGAIAYNNYIIENELEGFILNEIPEEYKID